MTPPLSLPKPSYRKATRSAKLAFGKSPVKPRADQLNARKEAVQARAQSTVEAILGATAQVLEGIGFDAATTNRIAERAGVSIGSLYQYFPNKEAIAGKI